MLPTGIDAAVEFVMMMRSPTALPLGSAEVPVLDTVPVTDRQYRSHRLSPVSTVVPTTTLSAAPPARWTRVARQSRPDVATSSIACPTSVNVKVDEHTKPA